MHAEDYTYMSGIYTMRGKFFNDKPVYEHESGDYFVFSRIPDNEIVTIPMRLGTKSSFVNETLHA